MTEDRPDAVHVHAHDTPALPVSPVTARVLVGVVLLLLAASLAGVLTTWPRAVPSAGLGYTGAEQVAGQVTSVAARSCRPTSGEERLPDGSLPTSVPCPQASVALDDGGSATITVPNGIYAGGLGAGDRVFLIRYPAADGAPETYVWQEVDRRTELIVTVVVFVLLTIVIGGRRGLAALAGLALGGVAIAYYLLPALLAQQNAVVVGLSAATLVMGVVIYLTHGISARTTVAYLGTVAGLLVTAGLAVLAVGANNLQGMDDENAATLTQLIGAPDLRGVVLAGTLVAALGLLNDVTITQAAAVWELRAADPGLGVRALFRAGMRVGRDHLASTVYTVAFAYAGAALPSLLALRLYAQPLNQVISQSAIATEIVRTAVGGAALALTVPATTALAAALVAQALPGRTASPA